MKRQLIISAICLILALGPCSIALTSSQREGFDITLDDFVKENNRNACKEFSLDQSSFIVYFKTGRINSVYSAAFNFCHANAGNI